MKKIILGNKDIVHILKIIRKLNLKQGVLAAGSIRNSIWQTLSNQSVSLQSDVDLVYFDPSKPQEYDFLVEQQLLKNYPEYNWQVKNEVYMHNYDFKNQQPFKSIEDAIAHFVETSTCIGAYLDTNGILKLITPYGVDDLVNFICRPVPAFSGDQQHINIFKKRIQRKNWVEKYPQLKIQF
ncbi:nucleotidyltransferase family protein [Liquorilactobacillus uvarum]|uniref:nucleotidyltransferase family protein n=1 Tax=Liquorilactobacillus uvarum TaxID=303240 RepID=UPI00288A6DEF|nr:nucleotidyltransferase family protein [Liquorilactobacillus uvarum]